MQSGAAALPNKDQSETEDRTYVRNLVFSGPVRRVPALSFPTAYPTANRSSYSRRTPEMRDTFSRFLESGDVLIRGSDFDGPNVTRRGGHRPLVQRWTSGGKRVFAVDIDHPLPRCVPD